MLVKYFKNCVYFLSPFFCLNLFFQHAFLTDHYSNHFCTHLVGDFSVFILFDFPATMPSFFKHFSFGFNLATLSLIYFSLPWLLLPSYFRSSFSWSSLALVLPFLILYGDFLYFSGFNFHLCADSSQILIYSYLLSSRPKYPTGTCLIGTLNLIY